MKQPKLTKNKIPTASQQPKTTTSAKSPAHPTLQLQAEIGNRAVNHLLEGQNRNSQSNPSKNNSRSLGSPESAKAPLIQAKSTFRGLSSELTNTSPQPTQQWQAANSGGQPMPEPVQQKMEAAFGSDFSDVRIHQGSEAQSIGALAYTQGNHIHFQPGQYNPTSQTGQQLLAHELAHVRQQRAKRVAVPQGQDIPINTDPKLEAEADRLGMKAARGEAVQTDSTGAGIRSNTPDRNSVVQCVAIGASWKKNPKKNNEDDWMVTPETWKSAEKREGESDESHKYRQLTNDAVIMYQTMFADPNDLPPGIQISPEQKQRTLAKQEFMRRLHLAMAVGGVKMSTEDNPNSSNQDALKDYEFPLASVLSHGQRHLFETHESELGEQLFQYLLSGSLEGDTSIVNARPFASHGTKIQSSGQIKELKYPFVKQFQGLFTGEHKGVNIPLGGIGNRDVNNDIIGPGGKPIDPETGKIRKGKQHGHIYINKHQRGKTTALMFGLEGAAPLKTNMFNVEHNASSGTEDQTKKISATGGQKLSKLLGEVAPAEYGGKRTILDKQKLNQIMQVEAKIVSLPIAQQQQIYKELLLNPPSQSIEILKKYLPEEISGAEEWSQR